MKKLFMTLVVGILLSIGIPQAEAIRSIVGTQVACDTTFSGCQAIPLKMTTLCTISCVQQSSFSFTNSSRFWGTNTSGVGICKTSTDGGATWPACTAQPFTTGNREFYAGAADGSVIAIGTPTGPNTCTIKRSTDNGASWTTVFTVVQQCTAGAFEGQRLYCLSDGRCEFVGTDGSTFTIFRSADSGNSWAAGETGTGGNCGYTNVAWDGNAGILPSEATGCGGGNIAKAGVAAADSWTTSVVWDGSQGDCWGAVVYNGVGRALCATTNIQMRSSAGALVSSFTLPGATNLIDNGGIGVGFKTNVLYVVAQQASPSSIGVWVSQDNLVTFNLIGVFSGGGTTRGGNVFVANGCIYVTAGSPSLFGKIC